MARAVITLVAAGALAVLATSVTICLDIIACVHAAEKSNLLTACSVGAAFQSVMLLIIGVLGIAQVVPTKVPMCFKSSRPALACQLFVCIAALIASAVALAYLREPTFSQQQDDADSMHYQRLFVGSVVTVTFATVLQLGFVILHFVVANQDLSAGAAPSFHSSEEGHKVNVKSIRYSRTLLGTNVQEMASVGSNDSTLKAPENPTMGPIDYLKASVSQAIRPASSIRLSSSRTKLLGSERRRPLSLDMVLPRKSTETSFDSWDTSSVDAHSRQAVMEMSSPTTLKKGLETIPASPSGSRTPSRPGTPLDMELEPPRRIYSAGSYSPSVLSQQDVRRLSPDSSVNELHIHPLFRSDSPTPPPSASPGTSVLAAPNAGRVISRQSSMQSLKRLRSGSLPATHSPLIRQTSLDSMEPMKYQKDDGDVGRRSIGAQGERKMTPPVPEWLLSPAMKASLDSFKEQKGATQEVDEA